MPRPPARTITDVARAARVGVGTVSRILTTWESYDAAKYSPSSLTQSFRLESSLSTKIADHGQSLASNQP